MNGLDFNAVCSSHMIKFTAYLRTWNSTVCSAYKAHPRARFLLRAESMSAGGPSPPRERTTKT